ncbi:MAG: tetratricopeptide repeat protein [Amnibacterium sp.]
MADEDERRPDRPRRERREGRPRDAARGDRPHRSERPLRPERGDRTGERPRRASTRDQGRPVVRAPGDRSRHAAGPRDERRGTGERLGAHRPDARPRRDDPPIPEDVTPGDLDRAARIELKTLTKENADEVARHLVMAARLIDDDPQLAHRHALAAAHRAGRIAIVRESVAITAYAIGDFALALRELRTFRRISGSDDQIALMVDSERGVGRPERALELGRSVDRDHLPLEAQVGLAIAMSGARLDQGDPRGALDELERAPIDLTRVHPWSPELFLAFAAVHEDLGDAEEADRWNRRAARAADLLDEVGEEGTSVPIVTEIVETDEPDEPQS